MNPMHNEMMGNGTGLQNLLHHNQENSFLYRRVNTCMSSDVEKRWNGSRRQSDN